MPTRTTRSSSSARSTTAHAFWVTSRRVQLVKGDAVKTIPKFVNDNPHVLVSLLFMDFDLYEPTRVALEHFLPRMPRGAIVAFDEARQPAVAEARPLPCWKSSRSIACGSSGFPFDPYIGYAEVV